MRLILIRILLSALSLAIVCVPQLANACMTSAAFHIEDIQRADAVFIGKLIRYEQVSPGRPNSLDEYGLLTVRVDKVLKGKVSGDVQLYWWNSTFGVPKTMERPEPILIAAVSANSKGLPLRGGSATVFPTQRPDLLQVMQAPCSGPFILSTSKIDLENIVTLIQRAPKTINSLEDINRDAREKLLASLKERVGDAYFNRLSFSSGELVDLGPPYHPTENISKLFAYRLTFKITDPSPGVADYTGAVEYRENGEIIRAEFPDIKHFPDRRKLVPPSCAEAKAAADGLTSPNWTTRAFDAEHGIVVYNVTHIQIGPKDPSDRRTFIINAHTCEKVAIRER